MEVKNFVARNYNNKKNSYLIVPVFHSLGLVLYIGTAYTFLNILLALDDMYNVDWDIVNINTLVETEVPNMEQRKSKFYKHYLEKYNVITPWYKNLSPKQVI